jgi:hypothetical protein
MEYTNARYEIFLCDSSGNRISSITTADTNQFIRFRAVRSLGSVGAITIEFTAGQQQSTFLSLLERFGALRKDTIIEVWRDSGRTRSLLLETVWWVRQVTRKMTEAGIQSIQVVAFDSIYLLASRININPFVGIQDSQLSLTGTPSLNMTNLVYQAFLPTTLYGDRSVPNLATPIYNYFESNNIQIDVSKSNLLDSLNLLSNVSVQRGAPMYFDIVASAGNSLMFQVFPDQRGLDRRIGTGTAPGIIIGSNTGIIRELTTISDWTEEITAVFPWGQNGSTVNGFITNPIFPSLISSTPYARREALSDAANGDNYQTLDIAYGLLQSKRASWNVSVTLQDTSDFIFGVDWGYGDRLYVNAFGSLIDCRISSIEVEMENKTEVLRLALNVAENII